MKKLKNKIDDKQGKYLRRKHRTNVISRNGDLPRLIVNKSNKFTYAQIIDLEGKVISVASDLKVKGGTKSERAFNVGQEVAKKALEKGVEKIAFDRNGNLYIGRIKSLADGAREAGLKF